jgi:hypothetical protein
MLIKNLLGLVDFAPVVSDHFTRDVNDLVMQPISQPALDAAAKENAHLKTAIPSRRRVVAHRRVALGNGLDVLVAKGQPHAPFARIALLVALAADGSALVA